MKKTVKRFLSMLLALSMMFGMLAVPVAATETEEPAATVEPAEEAAPAAETAEDTVPAAETTEDTVSEPATAEGAASAGETTEEAAPASQEEAEEPVVVVKGSSFTYKLNTDNIDVSDVGIGSVAVPEDAEIDEEDREIIIISEELKNITVLNEDGESVALTEEQIQTVLYLYGQYQDVMKANANIYGVQTPFFLAFNDDKDSLGILGEMLVLAGTSVDAVRKGAYKYDDLVGMIQNFIYTYQLGAQYYGEIILKAKDEALQAVADAGGDSLTEAQKLLVLNNWLAQNCTFDMPYIMNADKDESGKVEDDEKLMEARNHQDPEHYDDVYNIVYDDYYDSIEKSFHDEFFAGIEADLRQQFYENAIKDIIYKQAYSQVLTEVAKDENVVAASKEAYIQKRVDEEYYKAEQDRVYQEVYEKAYAEYLAEECTHDDVEASFAWKGTAADNFEGTTANIVCKTCAKTVEEDILANVTKDEEQHIDSKCNKKGTDVFVATVTYNEVEYSEEKTVELALAAHSYVDGKCEVCGAEEEPVGDGSDPSAEGTETPADTTVTGEENSSTVNALTPEEKADAFAKADAEKAVKERDEEIKENARKKAEAEYNDLSVDEKQKLAEDYVESNDDLKATVEDEANKAADDYMTKNADAIEEDAPGFVEANFGPEAAAQLASACDDFIKEAEETGVEVDPTNAPGYKMTVEDMTQNAMENQPILDLDENGENETTANQAIPIFATQAAEGMTTGVINGWKGCNIGALGFGTAVCLGYAKAYSYLVQCMHPEVYGTSADADLSVSENWISASDLYQYDEDGNLKLYSGYLVDTVRVTFDTTTSMYGNEGTFGDVHFWNAVNVGGQWYYIDPCYVDVYVEVMSRDRVETDGNMNHLYFMFSHTSAAKMYDGYVNTAYGDGDGITTFYSKEATDKSYEDSWMSRINCTPYFAGGYVYYVYDSSNLLAMMDSMNSGSQGDMDFSAFETHYKLARHKLTANDINEDVDGDSDFETLIDFNAEDEEENAEVQVRSASGEMVKNDLLTELYDRHSTYSEIYPSVEITSVLYGGKVYFNLANCILSYDPASCDVALVKEYNTVSANRDETVDFGGRAFFVEENGAYTVENHPIAALSLVGDELTVSIATNFALISGKNDLTNPAIKLENGDENGYGYEYEESNYNPSYNSYYSSDEENDNDEFMWSANFVDAVNMSHLAGGSHSYAEVTVDPFCGIDGYTEQRCTECGAIRADSRVYDDGTAHEHHYIHFSETYYTKSNGVRNTGDCYVCTMCGYAVSEPSEQLKEQAEDEYNRLLQEYNDAVESAGHTYVPTDAQWAEDSSSVEFTTIQCSNVCPTRKNRLDVLLNDNSITKELSEPVTNDEAEMTGYEGNCTEGLTAVYVASGEVEDANGTTYSYTATNKVQKEPGEHSYKGDFTWTENTDEEGNPTGDYTVTASLTCEICKHKLENIKATGKLDETKHEDPTCTEDGKDVYVATDFTDEKGNAVEGVTATKEEVISALGHKYDAHNDTGTGYDDTEEWNEDHTSVTVTFTCINEGSDAKPVVVTVPNEESNNGVINDPVSTDADCVKAGSVTYSATITLDGKEYTVEETVEGEALGHTYGEPEWVWAEDNSGATVSITCTREGCTEGTEGHKLTTEAKVTPETENATCIAAGKTVYTATATLNGTEYKDQKEVTIPQLSHQYSEPTFEWAEDGSSCVATYTCSVGGETETEPCTITSATNDATCTEAGTVVYTATVEVGGKTYTATKTVTGEALGHTYGTPEWNWAEGNSRATVSITCTREGCTEGTEGHKLTTEAKVTSVTEAATCTAAGKTVYTATATLNGEEHTDTKTVTKEALGHDYGEPEWSWTTDYSKATATFTCARCEDVQTVVDENVTKKTTEASCTQDGENVYTATVEFNGKTYTGTAKKTINALGHDYGEPVWNWATDYSTASATITCARCLEEVTDEAEVTHKTTQEATCNEEGIIVHSATVTLDGKTYTDPRTEKVPMLAHDYSAPTFVWEEDGSACVATYTCSVGGETVNDPCTITSETDDATCTEAGTVVYTATVEVGGKTYKDTKTIEGKPLGHTYGEPVWVWAEDYSTATATFTCTVCSEDTENHTLTIEAKVTSKTTKEPTCTEQGTIAYTATVTLNGETYPDVQTKAIAKLDHQYGAPTFAWEKDYSACEASYTCSVGGETESKPCTITSETKNATCTEAGATVYTATVEVDGKTYTDTKTKEIDPLGHTYGEPEWVWADHYSKATATITCEVCSDELTGEAKVTSKTTQELTCTVDGVVVYTATVTLNGETYTDAQTEVIEAKGHDYDEDGICKVCGAGNVRRISGKTRVDTALAIADELKKELGVDTFETILVANGGSFPDALAGSYLAIQKDAPILLALNTKDTTVNDKVLDYIEKNLRSDGTVYILGGTTAVSQAFEDGLKEAGVAYKRLSGKTRYDTGLKILEEAGLNGKEILVCTGENYADALSVSAVNKPILLVNGKNTELTAAQKAYLEALGDGYTFYIVGGTGAVSAELEEALAAYGSVERISGKGRHETSVAVAEKFFGDVDCATLAYSLNYPDGLCGGPLAYKLGAPLLLVKSDNEAPAAEYVKANNIKSGVVFGGTAGVTDESVRIVFDLGEDATIG